VNGNNSQIRKYQRRERKLRAAYRRRMFLVFILALAIGAVGGWFANERYGVKDDAVMTPGTAAFSQAYRSYRQIQIVIYH